MAEFTHARDKLAFLLSLVPYLIDHEAVEVREVARHFGVSTERVRESVRLIAISGVPGDSAAYQHGDLFDIDWDAFENDDVVILTHRVAIDDAPRFSGREAAALIAGLQYLQSLADEGDGTVLASLISKLTRGSSTVPEPVAVEPGAHDETISLARDALAASRSLEFEYLNERGEHQQRLVDPLRLESLDDDWYLHAWCHLREAVRTFRLDRMSAVAVSESVAQHRPSDIELADGLFSEAQDLTVVTLEVVPAAVPLIADYLSSDLPLEDHGEVRRARIRFAHLGHVARLVAGHPGMLRVIDPEEARRAVADWAARGLERYE